MFLVFVLQVFYIGVGFWFLNHDDISQAEKKIIVVTSWATNKITYIFNKESTETYLLELTPYK